jgi:hypothetical protein
MSEEPAVPFRLHTVDVAEDQGLVSCMRTRLPPAATLKICGGQTARVKHFTMIAQSCKWAKIKICSCKSQQFAAAWLRIILITFAAPNYRSI